MVSRMSKFFGSSEEGTGHEELGQVRRKAEDWVRRNPAAAFTIAALLGAMVIANPALRKMALPLLVVVLRRWMR